MCVTDELSIQEELCTITITTFEQATESLTLNAACSHFWQSES